MRIKTVATTVAIIGLATAGQVFAQASGGTGGTSASGPSGTSNGYSNPPATGDRMDNNPENTKPSTPAQNAPRSSLSPNAMTPRANPNGDSLPSTMQGYTNAQRTNQAPPNAGATNPNASAPR